MGTGRGVPQDVVQIPEPEAPMWEHGLKTKALHLLGIQCGPTYEYILHYKAKSFLGKQV